MADFRINVIVDPANAVRGTNRVQRQLNTLEATGQRVQRTFSNIFAIAGIGLTVREIIRLVDALTNAQNRIRLVTRDTAQLNAVTNELFRIARQTRVGFEATAEIYSRTALAVRDLGLSQRETLDFTESLNQAVILSGASATEANNALIQLSQGLASGTLRGDELRSVLEQLPRVADVIAQELGVTRGELRLLGEQGRISAEEIIEAFENASETLERDFATTIPTIGQAFAVLRSSILRFVNDSEEVQNATENLARLIILLADNLDVLAQAAIFAGTALGINFARRGVMSATIAVRALTVAIAANPIGLLLTTLTLAVSGFVAFGDEIKISSEGIATLSDLIDETTARLKPFIDEIIEGFNTVLGIIQELLPELDVSIVGILRLIVRFQDRVIGTLIGTVSAIRAIFSGLPDAIGFAFVEGINTALEALEDFINQVIVATNAVSALTGLPQIDLVDFDNIENNFEGGFAELGEAAREAFLNGFNQSALSDFLESIIEGAEARAAARIGNLTSENAGDGGLNDRPERVDRVPQALREQLRLLEEEARLLRLSNQEREVQTELLEIEETLRRQNTLITDAQRDLLEASIRRNQALRVQADLLEEIRGPQEQLIQREEALRELYADNRISLEEFNNELLRLVFLQSELNIQQGNGTFVDGFLVGIERMLEATRNFEAEAGASFANFFEDVTQGFSDAIANSIVFGESLEEALGNTARRALAGLLSQLIEIGIQYALNAALGETLAASATATGVAQAATLGAAFAGPAALVSLATSGANAPPAQAGIASTVALASSLGLVGFADGGLVRGPGGPRTDSVPAMLSNGEFVVNARSTARFRPVLEQMNNPRGFQDGGGVVSQGSSQGANFGGESGLTGQGSIRIVNNFDPNLFEDFVTSSRGERVIINVLERNSNSVRQILRNT